MKPANYILLPILLQLISINAFSQVAPDLSSEFLDGLPPSVRDEVEVNNALDADEEIQRLFRTETTLDKNKILLQKIKTQVELLDKRFDELESGKADNKELQTFGNSFFRSLQSSFMPINIANVSDDYFLGVGDSLTIILEGSTFRMNPGATEHYIKRDNSIIFDRYGKLTIGGMTLGDADKKIKEFFKIKDPSITPLVQVSKQRDIQVIVMGFVESPGIYTLSSGANILGALNVAGGISEQGSFRSIKHRRAGVEIDTVDLYELFVFGEFNPVSSQLRSGDVLFVDPKGFTVPITGGVNSEAVFEIKPEETIKDAITFAGGFAANHSGFDYLLLSRSSLNDIEFFEISKTDIAQTFLQPRDSIIVPSFENTLDSRTSKVVHILGRVKIPGKYTFREGETISDVIMRAGGYEDNAYIYGAALFRESAKLKEEIYAQLNYSDTVNFIISNIGRPGSNVNPSSLDLLAEELRAKRFEGRVIAEFDLEKLKRSSEIDLAIEDGDMITIPPIQNVVYMFGDFRNPSNITYDPSKSASEYIQLAGGTKESAYSEIIIIDPDGKTNIYNSSFFAVLERDIYIYPGSIIYAPRDIGKLTGVIYASTVAPILSSLAISLASLNSINN